VAMTNALREELFKLSAAERLELVEELWDSLSDDGEALALSDEQRADLERRLAEADADPGRRLQRRMQQIEKMSPRDKRQVLQLIDAFIERDQLRASRG
jgi:putative addiction module component (TIGR02574 family)